MGEKKYEGPIRWETIKSPTEPPEPTFFVQSMAEDEIRKLYGKPADSDWLPWVEFPRGVLSRAGRFWKR